jgi:hypothetical protein
MRTDMMVVSQEDRLPIRRPWLMLAIDVVSRVIAGFTISLNPWSDESLTSPTTE